jgi:hypothetical protein
MLVMSRLLSHKEGLTGLSYIDLTIGELLWQWGTKLFKSSSRAHLPSRSQQRLEDVREKLRLVRQPTAVTAQKVILS